MSIDIVHATAVRDGLRECQTTTRPVTSIGYEMKRRAREWASAVESYLEAANLPEDPPDDIDPEALAEVFPVEPEALIELLGSVTPGMYVWNPTVDDRDDAWCFVVRCLVQGGQWSLHLESSSGKTLYANFFGQSSPVLVKR